MGLSLNLEVFLSEKHHNKDREFAAQTVQEDSDNAPLGLKKLKIPPPCKDEEEEREGPNDGYETPTAQEQRIPAVLPCPPAPRKAKTTVSPSKKRRKGGCNRPRVVLDVLSQEIESFFAAVGGAGEKNKKVKTVH